jgi:hypothetical protein
MEVIPDRRYPVVRHGACQHWQDPAHQPLLAPMYTSIDLKFHPFRLDGIRRQNQHEPLALLERLVDLIEEVAFINS